MIKWYSSQGPSINFISNINTLKDKYMIIPIVLEKGFGKITSFINNSCEKMYYKNKVLQYNQGHG